MNAGFTLLLVLFFIVVGAPLCDICSDWWLDLIFGKDWRRK